jgi:hypothetical protein
LITLEQFGAAVLRSWQARLREFHCSEQNHRKQALTLQMLHPWHHISNNPEYYNVALGETGSAVRTLPPSARRSIAALWFAAFAALATFLFFSGW